MMKVVTREVLALHDKFEGDIGLVDEPWVSKKSREEVRKHLPALQMLGEYVDQLYFVKVETLSADLRSRTLERIEELESVIADEVIDVVKKRMS